MASITIRNLDQATKQALRERAARNGRSMEEEARLLLGGGGIEPAVQQAADRAAPRQVVGQQNAPHSRVVLIISGGIAAYKSLDLIRRLRERAISVRVVMTAAAQNFITPMAAGALSGGQVFTDLWDRASEHDIGHIRLAREAGLIIIAPATANMLARMASGIGNDLATAVLLAARCPILAAPAMNPQMWANRATRRNIATLADDGIFFVGPNSGEMAEAGEAGPGRMAEPLEITASAMAILRPQPKPLHGLKAIVTSGPTLEPIDPVRYIANRSSGKQGHAIAAALAEAGASVVLVSGPVALQDPPGVSTRHVETARQMQAAVEAALPADIAVMVAAVADWRIVSEAEEKLKKTANAGPPILALTENPDILKGIGHHAKRPRLVIGFAAETENVEEHARVKLHRKRADWIIANDVSSKTGIMGGEANSVLLITKHGTEHWPNLPKDEVARRLVGKITEWFVANTAEA